MKFTKDIQYTTKMCTKFAWRCVSKWESLQELIEGGNHDTLYACINYSNNKIERHKHMESGYE